MADKNGKLGWLGYLTSNRNKQYKVFIEYPDDFPYSPPPAYILKPKLNSQHIWDDGSLCLLHSIDDVWSTESTAVVIVARSSGWIFSYEYHRAHCRRSASGGPCPNLKCPDWPGSMERD